MLEIKDFATPSPKQWQMVIHGCRNAYKSWNKSDSHLIEINVDSYDSRYREGYIDEKQVDYQDAIDMIQSKDYDTLSWIECEQYFRIGKNDKRLLMMLTSMGTSDRKALRQLPIILEVKAPLYWWKQADKYQIGTTTNSESTMHTITKDLLTKDDFSTDTWAKVAFPYGKPDMIEMPDGEIEPVQKIALSPEWILDDMVGSINELLEAYRECKDEDLWNAIIGLLPESYFQTRTWSINYEVALSIIGQRMFHDLPEWKTLIVFLLNHIPYLLDLAVAAGYVKRSEDGAVLGVKDGKEEVLYQ